MDLRPRKKRLRASSTYLCQGVQALGTGFGVFHGGRLLPGAATSGSVSFALPIPL